jgi:hypothetical protein
MENTCLSCGSPLPTNNIKYCEFSCYKTYLTQNNHERSRWVYLDGEKTTTTDALKKTGLNHYSFLRAVLHEENNLRPYPDQATYRQASIDALYHRHPALPSIDDVRDAIKQRKPLKTLAAERQVTYNAISTLCLLTDTPTTFHQIDQHIRQQLDDPTLVNALYDTHGSAEAIAKELAVSPSLVLQTLHKHNIILEPSHASIGEKEVRQFVESLGYSTVKRKTRTYEIDIFIPELHIGIEYNGRYWHSHCPPLYHQKKYHMAREDNIRLVQIWDTDWHTKPSLIKRKLTHLLGASQEDKVMARKCGIEAVSGSEAAAFMRANHLQGAKPCSHYFGLQYNSSLVAVLSFRNNKLERYATSTIVNGGFQKLFTHALHTLQLDTVDTYVDLMWSDHEKNQYVRSGFVFKGITKPNYVWVKGPKMLTRYQTQKSLLTSFPSYSSEKTEKQILEESGYRQVFDAGNARLRYTV